MNEEVIVAIGADTTAVGRALRGVSGQVKSWATETKTYFNDAFKGIVGAFGLGEVISKLKEIGEMAKRVKAESQGLGISVETLQGVSLGLYRAGQNPEDTFRMLQKLSILIGQAANGVEVAQKKFEKWGISLTDVNGRVKTTDEILSEVSDKIKGTEDGATRAAIAFDLFGKGGAKLIPVLQGGAAGLDDLRHSFKVFSEQDIEALHSLVKGFEELGKGVEFVAVKGVLLHGIVEPIARTARYLGALSTMTRGRGDAAQNPLKAFSDALDYIEEKQKEVIKGKNEIEEKPEAKAARDNTAAKIEKDKEEIGRLDHQLAEKRMTDEEKLLEIKQEWYRLLKEASASERGSVAFYGKIIAAKKMELEYSTELTKQVKEREQIEKRKDDLRKRGLTLFHSLENANAELASAKAGRSKFTLQELAESPIRFSGKLEEERQTAMRVQQLERWANFNRLHGFNDVSESQLNIADKLRRGLTNVTDADRNPFASMEKGIESIADNLDSVITEQGMLIVPVNSK